MQRLPKHYIHLVCLVLAALTVGWSTDGLATGLFSGEDAEKPKPEFSRSGERVTAELIPRAKSTRVTIEFEVASGGRLESIKGIDFATVDRPEVDIKNFKSAVFEIAVRDVARGGKATVAMRSDFFTLSTAFYVFNPKRAQPWIRDTQTENRALPNRVRELIVQVQDGGDLDADGQADGRIVVTGGPRDSFWGYALGTLFIRFFGIFIVLTILMIGMLVSGRIFKIMDRSADAKSAAPPGRSGQTAAKSPVEEERSGSEPVPEETVAAIAAALYLRDHAPQAAKSAPPQAPETGMAWPLEGRKRMMNDRLMVFNLAGRTRI
jgi:hypothetical protein